MQSFFDVLHDLLVFTYRVLAHWQGYVTGGVLVALLVVLEHVRDFRLSRRAYIEVFVIGSLFVAFFVVWREEYIKTKPMIEAKIGKTEFISVGKDLLVLPSLRLMNKGSVPMGVENFSILYNSVKGEVLRPEPVVVAGTHTIAVEGENKKTIAEDDLLFGKIGKPIGAGDFIIGLLPFRLPGDEAPRMRGARFTYCFDDFASNHYCLQMVADNLESVDEAGMKVFPGERLPQ